MQSVSSPSATLCVAVDANGNVLTSTGPTGGATTWQRWLVDPGTWLASISYASAAIVATNVKVVPPTEFTAVTGGGAKTGTWNLMVTIPGGTSVGTSGDYCVASS
jgi:hypothetical protein